jgi:hypothetical protein
MSKIINVTQEHIDKGVRENRTSCPVAIALREQGFPLANVWTYSIHGLSNGKTKRIGDGDVGAWVRDFDCGLDVKPFSFDLDELEDDE